MAKKRRCNVTQGLGGRCPTWPVAASSRSSFWCSSEHSSTLAAARRRLAIESCQLEQSIAGSKTDTPYIQSHRTTRFGDPQTSQGPQPVGRIRCGSVGRPKSGTDFNTRRSVASETDPADTSMPLASVMPLESTKFRCEEISPEPGSSICKSIPNGTLIYIRRTNDSGNVDLLGHCFEVDLHWVHRLVRAEVRFAFNRNTKDV